MLVHGLQGRLEARESHEERIERALRFAVSTSAKILLNLTKRELKALSLRLDHDITLNNESHEERIES